MSQYSDAVLMYRIEDTIQFWTDVGRATFLHISHNNTSFIVLKIIVLCLLLHQNVFLEMKYTTFIY